MEKHRAVYLSSGALKRSYIPGQLVKEGQMLGILSFKGRIQCKPWSSLSAAGLSRAIGVLLRY